ncbi:MAG: aminoacyltransferase [Bifidobacteriaceae bacterium]|jgi:lipid II:glycine glycyltransferase (peptidoglycan interpeptide bridge formation enzyme)|nr:aminoacyltransferase [Bifidobacteriaceae bacterium]
MPLTARPIDSREHLAWIACHGPVSFMQTPAWGLVKSEWRRESVGIFDAGRMVGAVLMLMRPVPVGRAVLAYVPECPLIPAPEPAPPSPHAADGATSPALAIEALAALADLAASRHAFALTVGPTLWWRRWHAATIKAALAGSAARFGDVPPDEVNPLGDDLAAALAAAGWSPPVARSGFGLGQPDFVFQLPLAGATEPAVLAGFNQLWRRNIRKAHGAGVHVRTGTREDMAAFHQLYVETARRDQFTPRPLAYFERMWDAEANEAGSRIALYLAHHEDDLVASTIALRVPGHTWYVYGASSTAKREVRGSNAIQWEMVRDAIGHGDAVYDMRGITDTLDAADPHVGLIQFKVGTGGRAQQYLGEWTYAIRPTAYRAFQYTMRSAMALRERRRR